MSEANKEIKNDNTENTNEISDSEVTKTDTKIKGISLAECLLYKNLVTPALQNCILHISWKLFPASVQVLPQRISLDKALYAKMKERFIEHMKQLEVEEKKLKPKTEPDTSMYAIYTQEEALNKILERTNPPVRELDLITYKMLCYLIDLTDSIDDIIRQTIGYYESGNKSKDSSSEPNTIKKIEDQLIQIQDHSVILNLIKEDRLLNLEEDDLEYTSNHFIKSIEDIAMCIMGLQYGSVELLQHLLIQRSMINVCNKQSLDLPTDNNTTTTTTTNSDKAIKDGFTKGGVVFTEWCTLHNVLLDIILPLTLNQYNDKNKNISELNKMFSELKGYIELTIVDESFRSNPTEYFQKVIDTGMKNIAKWIGQCIDITKMNSIIEAYESNQPNVKLPQSKKRSKKT